MLSDGPHLGLTYMLMPEGGEGFGYDLRSFPSQEGTGIQHQAQQGVAKTSAMTSSEVRDKRPYETLSFKSKSSSASVVSCDLATPPASASMDAPSSFRISQEDACRWWRCDDACVFS